MIFLTEAKIDTNQPLELFFPAADREVQRILLELLNQMDGFDQNVNVKVRSVHSP